MTEDTAKCSRCGAGVDDDGDGDCAVCASAGNQLVAALQARRAHGDRVALQLHSTILLLDAAKRSHASTVREALDKAARLVETASIVDYAPGNVLAERVRALKEDYV